jgi:hypothetical protein
MNIVVFLFSLLNLAFITGLLLVFTPVIRGLGFSFLLLVGAILLVFGILLIVFVSVKNIDKDLKNYLNLTAISAIVIVASSIFHNLFYALEVATSSSPSLSGAIGSYGSGFFIIAIIVAPILFIINSFRTIRFFVKNK